MSGSTTTVEIAPVEIKAPQKTWAGQSVPRKEDKRLTQGEGVFVDDIKRHGMGYIHFVRSPYAHAHITSIDVSKAEAGQGRLRDAHRRGGRVAHRSVLPALDAAGRASQGLRARGRQGALRRRGGRRGRRRDARARARRLGARRGRVRAARRGRRRAEGAGRRRAGAARGLRLEPDVGGRLRVGRPRRRVRRGGQDREDRRAALPPLQLDAARVRRRARRVQPRHGAVDALHEQPVPRLRADHDGAGDALRARQAALRHAGHRRRLRQQDHVAPAARRVLPARAEAQPRRAVDGVAHGLPHVDVARQRALVPRHRGRGQERRHAARLPHEGARRRGRVAALRAARRRHLGAGHARRLQVAEHPPRVHAGRDEQGAVLAEPRLLAHAAPLVHRARDRHRRARARARPDRGAEAQLHQGRGHAVRDAERLRLRLRRLRADARHRDRPHRLDGDRGRGARRRRRAAGCSASASARRSTPARTTSASRG